METTPDNLSLAVAESIRTVSSFVVPIYGNLRNRPQLIGTGFFIDFNGKTILVSARHVLEETNQIFTYKSSNKIIQITGKRYLSHESLDIGFIVTDNCDLPWPTVGKFPCSSSYLMANRLPRRSKHYAIVGFPASKNKVNPTKNVVYAAIHGYHAESIDDNLYVNHDLSPKDHVVLPLDLKIGFDIYGNHVNNPKPQGMSGSPIWELFDEKENTQQPRVFPIVAVATDFRKKEKIVFGTDVFHLLNGLNYAA